MNASTYKNKKTVFVYAGFLWLVLSIGIFVGNASAAVNVLGGVDCHDLIAGQSIDSGDVCLEVSGDYLNVTYNTVDGWELLEAHLFVGNDLADMPMTKKGNPKIGNFPYLSGDITGLTTYTFSVPLSALGAEAELCDPDKVFYLAAHASVRKSDGSGGYQTETGWGSGYRLVEKGSWAMYFTFQFECDNTPPPEKNCETAFSFGDKKLWDILDVNGDPITNRWGWQVTVYPNETLVKPIYAGAGQNDITKGTYVGDLHISYDGSTLLVDFIMLNGSSYTMDETHLYAGVVETDTAAPGQFGHLNENLGDATSDSYSISISGSPIYVVAHAVVCGF